MGHISISQLNIVFRHVYADKSGLNKRLSDFQICLTVQKFGNQIKQQNNHGVRARRTMCCLGEM